MDEFRFELPAVWFGRLQDEDMKCFDRSYPIFKSAFFQNPMFHTLQSGLILDPHHLSFIIFLDTLR